MKTIYIENPISEMIAIQAPRKNKYGFSLFTEDMEFEGGIGLEKVGWRITESTNPKITPELKRIFHSLLKNEEM
jgi:hypothetical protein